MAAATVATGTAVPVAAVVAADTAVATTGAIGAEMARRALAGVVLPGVLGVAALAAAPAGPTLDVKVSAAGFTPARIVLHRGETTRLSITSEAGEHCFAVDALRVEKRVVPGRPTRVDLTPERLGSFAFYCCVESGAQAERERGELVVTE